MDLLLILLNLCHWLSFLTALGLAGYCFVRPSFPLARPLAAFLGCMAIWCFVPAVSLHVEDLATHVLLNRLKMFAVALVACAILFLAAAMRFKKTLRWGVWGLVFLPLVAAALLNLTPWHELLITGYHRAPIGSFSYLFFENGPVFKWYSLYARLLILVACVLILTAHLGSHRQHTRNSLLLTSSIVFPFVFDSLGVMFFPMFRYLQVTPAFFLFSEALIILAIYRFHFLTLLPVARSYVMESSDDVYLIFDTNDTLVDVNHNSQLLFTTAESPLGLKGPQVEALLSQHRERGSVQLRGQHFHESVIPLAAQDGSPLGKMVLLKNITLQKQVERQLEELNEMKSHFLSVVGHDLQGNLAGLKHLSENLHRQSAQLPPEELKAHAEGIFFNARRCIDFIDQILQWSRAHVHHVEAVTTDTDLREIADECLQFVLPLALDRDVELDNQIPAGLLVRTDVNILRTILRNLLSNALKASPAQGRVWLAVDREASTLKVLVVDEGTGLDVAAVNALLAGSAPAKKGIGLVICRDLARKINARISAEAREPRGATFVLRLSSLV